LRINKNEKSQATRNFSHQRRSNTILKININLKSAFDYMIGSKALKKTNENQIYWMEFYINSRAIYVKVRF